MVTHAGPDRQDHALVRSEKIVQLIDQVRLDDAPTSFTSDAVECGPFRRFALYLRVKSTSTSTHIVQFIVEFLDPRSGKWHKYNQGLFASLYYEDTVTATEQDDIYEGLCAGRVMRVRAEATNTTSANYFTISAAVEFFN